MNEEKTKEYIKRLEDIIKDYQDVVADFQAIIKNYENYFIRFLEELNINKEK